MKFKSTAQSPKPAQSSALEQSPILIHVPHSSTFIPSEEWQYFATNNLQREILCMTDHYCDDLFSAGHEMICFPISRLVCDVERFRDDFLESMSAKGMGVVYTRCSDGTKLKRIPEEHKNYILNNYYDEHHRILTEAVESRIRKYGKCIIVDGHTFCETPLAYEYDQCQKRADICIGTDEFHTPKKLVSIVKTEFTKRGYSVSVDSPFSGAMVPAKYYLQDNRVISIMIEINRKLYIDHLANRTNRYQSVKRDISEILKEMV